MRLIDLVINGEKQRLYQPLDAMQFLNVSSGTLNRYRREGFLEGIPVGRGFLYTREMLEDCIRNLGKDRENINVEVINSGRE
jgi:predicted site-specific integrase-resolvase